MPAVVKSYAEASALQCERHFAIAAAAHIGEPMMAFKDILLQLNSYPDEASITAIARCVGIAGILGGKITALTFEIDIEVPELTSSTGLHRISAIIAGEKARSSANARGALQSFSEIASRYSLSHEQLVEKCNTANIPSAVAKHSRTRDLTIVPIESPAGFQRNVAETVIFGSGRPVIVVPADEEKASATLDAIGIAWDGSRSAVRAVADAMPILIAAKTVSAVTVTDDETSGNSWSTRDLARHLALHGVEPIMEGRYAAGRTIGQTLTEYVDERSLDLLVMGAFGHSRMRDFFLGGPTESLIVAPPIPIFFSH